jgi:hypothetical protein
MEQLVGVCNPLISLKPLREGLQHENPQKNEGKTARNPYLMGGSSGDPSRTGTIAQINGLRWLTGLKALIALKWLLSALAHQMSE